MRQLSLLALVPVSLLLVAGCQSASPTARGTAPGQVAAVEVDIMSGVPNPTWTTDEVSAFRLTELVADMHEGSQGGETVAAGLGFRGFIVRGLDLTGLGTYDELRVLGETVIASGETAADLRLRDPERAMFTELRTASEQHLAPDVFDAIPADGLQPSDVQGE